MLLHMLIVAALVVMATANQTTLTSGSDSTRIPGAKGTIVVDQTMYIIKTACVFGDDKLFMRRLAYVESLDGVKPDAFRTGYDGGIWQVDQVMFNKLKEPESHQVLSNYTNQFSTSFGKDWATTTWDDCRKPLFSALAARLYIHLSIDPIGMSFPRDIPAQGSFWTTYYRNGNDANIFINKANKLNKGCKISGVDLVFILDSSGSVGSTNFAKMKRFVTAVVQSFNVSTTQTRVGVMTYSSSVSNNFYLNRYNTKSQVLAAVNNIRYTGGGTNTHLALDSLYQTMFTTNNGARNLVDGVPRVGIFLTDGRSNDPSRTVLSALKVHDADITMFAVGVGANIGKTELEAIASTPECLHLFMLTGFNEVESLKYAIEKGACDAPVITSPGKNGTKIESLVSSDGQNWKVKVPAEGATIQIVAKSGAVLLFVSTTTYPSEAYYDAMVSAELGKPGVIFLQKPPTPDMEGIVYCHIKSDTDNKTESEVAVGIIPGDVDHCRNVNCENGGTCVDDLHSSYSCSCAAGFEGTRCETVKVSDCSTNNPCNAANRDAGKYYFAHVNPNQFVQCDDFGACSVRDCPTNLKWNINANTCTE